MRFYCPVCTAISDNGTQISADLFQALLILQARFRGGSPYIKTRMTNPGFTNPDISIPVREPAAESTDDAILPFQVAALELRGQVVRLGPLVDEILSRHNYPLPVAKLVGEAIVLTVLLGSTLKFEGRFIFQTQTDGPVRMLVIDLRSPGKVRACARFDVARVEAAIASGQADPGSLLGRGHPAMTIDQGPETSRYQGVVALDGGDPEAAAHE